MMMDLRSLLVIIISSSLSLLSPVVHGLNTILSNLQGYNNNNNNNAKNPVVGRVKAGPMEISALGCGTWSWGNRLLWNYNPNQDVELYRAYQTLRDAGVTIFDTADSYGTFDLNGRAEILLGDFERRYHHVSENQQQQQNQQQKQQQQVATKFAPYPWRITRGSMINAAQSSLKRLDQQKLSIAQLHWSTVNYQPFQERALWEGIADVYDDDLCDAVGVSNYGPDQLMKFASRMKERNVPLASAQIQYSLMTYKAARMMKDACDDVDCALISYSPLCLGLLTGKYDEDHLPRGVGNPRRQLFRELLPGAKGLLGTLGVVAEEYGKTMSQIAINWALCKGTVPIPGGRTLEQVEENLGCVGWLLGDDAVEVLDRAAFSVEKPMIQNIFQTK